MRTAQNKAPAWINVWKGEEGKEYIVGEKKKRNLLPSTPNVVDCIFIEVLWWYNSDYYIRIVPRLIKHLTRAKLAIFRIITFVS